MNPKILFLLAFILPIWAGKAQNLVNQGTLKINAGTTLRIAGNITNDGATGNLDNAGNVRVVGDFTQTNGATYSNNGTVYLEGTTEQSINSSTALSISTLEVNNHAGAKINNDLTINNLLTLTTGDLDLNGKNITLNGTLVEDRASNHLVKDLTATSEANQGGAITFAGTVTNATTDIAGAGLYLQRTSGSDYAVTVTRKHYRGAGASAGGKGIKRIYRVTGSPTGTNTTMRIYYANDELADVSGTLRLFRWQSATGWKQATDAGSGFANGTNGAGFVEATGINGFSDWTVGAEDTPLPITLVKFAGERVEQAGEQTETVKLTWTTASEINNKGFEIQVSDNAQTFKNINFVEGKGNSTTVSSYQLAVSNPNDGYYRLKQVDFDGKFSYSPIVFVEGIETLNVYPNPNNGTFTISVGKDKLDLPARLLNAQGVEVWRGTQTEVKTNLPAGMYFLHTTQAGKTKITKIIIEH